LTPKKTTAGDDLVDLFRPYGIPPTRLHRAVQEAATEAGWIAPWDPDAVKLRNEKPRNKAAGKQSGLVRAGRANLRLLFVKEAYDRLKMARRMEPFSVHSMDDLMAKYREVIAESGDPTAPFDADLLMLAAPFKADRDTLKNDLILLGIRSKRATRRSG
jgi:hypothetical protein